MAAEITGRDPQRNFGLGLARAAYRSRRRIATVAAIALAVLIGYHVVNGHNGITVYQQKRAEDKALKLEIDQLKQENLQLKDHVERLQTDPDAIIHEARKRLHYTRPGEVIYTLNESVDNVDGPGSIASGNDETGNDRTGNDRTGEAGASKVGTARVGKEQDLPAAPKTSPVRR